MTREHEQVLKAIYISRQFKFPLLPVFVMAFLSVGGI